MSNAGDPAGAAAAAAAAATPSGRVPRLPRWTRQEILVLIEGKRMVEARGGGRGGRGRAAAAAAAAAGGGETAVAALEPKWAAVAEYCRRHGVERGAVQCRKRWSNLAGDYKKIKEWERGAAAAAGAREPSFWAMRNDARRERRLPGFFDREVYDILDGRGRALVAASSVGNAAHEEEDAEAAPVDEETEKEKKTRAEETVFDSGRPAAEESLFSDDEEEEEEETPEAPPATAVAPAQAPARAVIALPISKKAEASRQHRTEQGGTSKDKQPEQQAASRDPPPPPTQQQQGGQKRRRADDDDDEGGNNGGGSGELQSRLVEILDRNSRMVAAQLEAQNANSRLDREQRRDEAASLVVVLGRLADALGRIADKL